MRDVTNWIWIPKSQVEETEGFCILNFLQYQDIGITVLDDSCRQLGRKDELTQLAGDLATIGFEAVESRTFYADAFAV